MVSHPKILVTRPQPDADDTAGRLNALDLDPVIAPLLEMHPLDPSLPEAKSLAAMVLTSANALRALDQRDQLTSYTHLPVFTVGDRTAAEAALFGFDNITSANGSFTDLVTLLNEQVFDAPLFYPTTTTGFGDLGDALAVSGAKVLTTRSYEMRPIVELPANIITMLNSGEISAVSLYSRRTAESFCALARNRLDKQAYSALTALCLSENVAAPMIANHFTRIALADYPSEEAMMALALSFARDQIR